MDNLLAAGNIDDDKMSMGRWLTMLHGLTKDDHGVIGFVCYWKGSASQKKLCTVWH